MKRAVVYALVLMAGIAGGAVFVWFYKGAGRAPQTEAKAERKILFYRNPMNPDVTSPTPMDDDMGMPYVPVYEDEAADAVAGAGVVRITPEKIQKIGVASEEAKRRTLKRTIRTVGRIEPVEDKVYAINAKVSGWVERLYVGRTDQMVTKGGALLELYSPDLVSAQEEYLLAWKALKDAKESPYPEARSGAETLVNAAQKRLLYWDISDDQIERLKETGAIKRTMTMLAPATGSVTEKMVVEGQKIEAGEPLFKIIDHSVVWVYGEIYEYEIPYIKTGQGALLSPSYSAVESYGGTIEHVYSHLGSIRYTQEEGTEIRTAKVRFELSNPSHSLKLGMYMNVEISVTVAVDAVSVPDSSVIDTGVRQVVIIDRRDGRFEPREVMLGARAEDFHEIKRGIEEGEWVVTSANFLLDSESNLKAAVGGLGLHQHKSGQEEPSGEKSEGADENAHGHAGH